MNKVWELIVCTSYIYIYIYIYISVGKLNDTQSIRMPYWNVHYTYICMYIYIYIYISVGMQVYVYVCL